MTKLASVSTSQLCNPTKRETMNFLRNSYAALISFAYFVNVSVAEEPVQIPCEQTVFLKQAQYQTAVDIFYKYVGAR